MVCISALESKDERMTRDKTPRPESVENVHMSSAGFLPSSSLDNERRSSVVERRLFLLGLSSVGCAPTEPAASPRPGRARQSETTPGEIPRRRLGATEERVSALGLGGFHIGVPSEKEAMAIMHRAIDHGMNFFDNCWDYHKGESEVRMGKALQGGKREKVFLMTKIDGRTKEAAALQIDQCLRRLQTDHVDLMQVHEVIRDKDPAWVFGEDGAIAALREAKQAGKLRYIGFTGHKSPKIHLSMLDMADRYDFRFDAVQMPLNVLDPHYESFQKNVLPLLVDKDIGVLGMKALASGAALEAGVEAEECLRYALSLPTSVVITGCDEMKILDQAIRVGRTFAPLSEEEMNALEAKTSPQGSDGSLEGFKTSEKFDATTRNPRWLTTGEV